MNSRVLQGTVLTFAAAVLGFMTLAPRAGVAGDLIPGTTIQAGGGGGGGSGTGTTSDGPGDTDTGGGSAGNTGGGGGKSGPAPGNQTRPNNASDQPAQPEPDQGMGGCCG